MSPNVPSWGQLPTYAQCDLSSARYDRAWFDGQPDAIRLTVLNLYVKLRGMDNLWRYVTRRDTTPIGALEFSTRDVVTLRRELTNRPDFTVPQDSLVSWECREKRAACALHFKHFPHWDQAKVQAHIDKVGLGFGGKWSPPIIGPLVMGPAHLADYCKHGWQDVPAIRNSLLQQGWDRQPLLGVGA